MTPQGAAAIGRTSPPSRAICPATTAAARTLAMGCRGTRASQRSSRVPPTAPRTSARPRAPPLVADSSTPRAPALDVRARAPPRCASAVRTPPGAAPSAAGTPAVAAALPGRFPQPRVPSASTCARTLSTSRALRGGGGVAPRRSGAPQRPRAGGPRRECGMRPARGRCRGPAARAPTGRSPRSP